MIDKEYKYFKDNRERLVKEYPSKFVVIVGKSVTASYDTMEEAYAGSIKKYKLGKFLIQQCVKKNLDQSFFSRAVFN